MTVPLVRRDDPIDVLSANQRVGARPSVETPSDSSQD